MSLPVKFTPPFRQLVEGVRAYFAENGVSAVVERGITRSHEKPLAGLANRVIFYSSPPSGAAGSIANPRQSGHRQIGADATTDPPTLATHAVRPLSDWVRSLYVSIWARDADRPNDEGAQDDAVYQLFMWVQRAVQSVAFGNAVWGRTQFVVPTDRAFGLELLVDLTFQHAMFDLPEEIGHPDPNIVKGPLP